MKYGVFVIRSVVSVQRYVLGLVHPCLELPKDSEFFYVVVYPQDLLVLEEQEVQTDDQFF